MQANVFFFWCEGSRSFPRYTGSTRPQGWRTCSQERSRKLLRERKLRGAEAYGAGLGGVKTQRAFLEYLGLSDM